MPEFTLNRNHRLVSLTGHTIQFTKDEPVFVPQECKAEAIAIGAQPTDGNTDVLADEVVVVELTAEEREEQLIKAFKTLQGRNERGDFTGQGIQRAFDGRACRAKHRDFAPPLELFQHAEGVVQFADGLQGDFGVPAAAVVLCHA